MPSYLVSTDASTVNPEITTKSDAQDEADRKNVFCLAAIGVKEGIAEGITKIVGKDITNLILQTTENSDFKYVDKYQIHQLLTAITERVKISEATNIRRQFVNIAGTILDWRETVVTNVECMIALAENHRGTECGYTSTSEWSLYSPTQNGRNNIHGRQKSALPIARLCPSTDPTTATTRIPSARSSESSPLQTHHEIARNLRRQGNWHTWSVRE